MHRSRKPTEIPFVWLSHVQINHFLSPSLHLAHLLRGYFIDLLLCFFDEILAGFICHSSFSSGSVGCHRQRTRRSIQPCHRAQWDSPLLGDVSDRNARDARYAECVGQLSENIVEGASSARRLLAIRAIAERDRLAAVESAAQLQLLKHPVDAIHGLIGILED